MSKHVEVRPFAELAAEARRLGFEMLYSSEGPRGNVGRVSIRLEPITRKAREALRRYADDPTCDGFESETAFQVVERDPELAINNPVDVAVNDTARYALSMVRKALTAFEARS